MKDLDLSLRCKCLFDLTLLVSTILIIRNLQTIRAFNQNFFKYALEFIWNVSKTKIGEEYGPSIPFNVTPKLSKDHSKFPVTPLSI